MTDPLNLTCSKENTFHTIKQIKINVKCIQWPLKYPKENNIILCVYVCAYLIQ